MTGRGGYAETGRPFKSARWKAESGDQKFGRRWNPKKKKLGRGELRYSSDANGTVRVNYLLEETDLMYNNSA
jgi:hypothetical protein